MGTHVKILGYFYIGFSAIITLMVLVGHISFFFQFSESMNSVMASEMSFSEKYFDFFGKYGITPFGLLNTLFNITTGFAFGYGILRYREWARLLGILLALPNVIKFGPDVTSVIQMALSLYTFWVLLSKDVSDKCRTVFEEI
jgi:hypothetical protein